ncbi:MAG: hypothetical protein B7C24_09665 [Bacteroidetes bacterium 4572_77]|nr:MAG: hypothetical protein B7C24_09665 [Bacteroidetes bacterium 4572_77]
MTISEDLNKPYFNIIDLGDLHDQEKSLDNKEGYNNFYAIYFIHEGELTFSTTSYKISAEYSTLLFIPSNIEHQITIKKKSKGSLIYFNSVFYNSIKHKLLLEDYLVFHQEKLATVIRLSEKDYTETKGIINLLKLEAANDISTNTATAHQLLSYFLSKSKEKFIAINKREEKKEATSVYPIFNEFKEIIESNFSTDRNIASYANKLNIHPNCLNEISKLSSGQTASEVIHHRIISETKKLILSTDKSFKEISYKLGFDDPAYFSRYFKKHTGLTLSQYQNETRDMSK